MGDFAHRFLTKPEVGKKETLGEEVHVQEKDNRFRAGRPQRKEKKNTLKVPKNVNGGDLPKGRTDARKISTKPKET